MPDIIQLLPDSIANRIAAGEVVRRPASAVKELMENAVDAGATAIQLQVKDAGKTLIRVIDNGKGMSATDARMSFERHATSKISKDEDLFNIRTMGFRGEAVASIAAVAQVELKTKREGDELGTEIVVAGSELKEQKPTACAKGTSFSVKNLFYNVPARRNFLKSDPVEMRHILDEFQRIALAFPEIGFKLYQNDLEVFDLHPENLSKRIVTIFGKNYREQLIPCKEETELITVAGFIGKPEFSKKTRGEQFFFANKRFIRHPYLHHAVINAFEGLLPEGSHPFYALFIDIDPQHVDINVHPSKTEIKFDDDRLAYGIVKAAVAKALSTHHVTPALDFGTDVNFGSTQTEQSATRNDYSYKKPEPTYREQSNLKNWENLYQGAADEHVPKSRSFTNESSNSAFTFKIKSEFDNTAENEQQPVPSKPFQIHGNYIICSVKSGMMVIDRRAAHERILYEKFIATDKNKPGGSQQLLFPENISLSASDIELVKELKDDIKTLGFDFEFMGNKTIVVNGIPADIPPGRERGLLEGLLEQFKQLQSELKIGRRENLARVLAKRAAAKNESALEQEEMRALIDRLFACQTPSYAPDGRRTAVTMSIEEISTLFNPTR